MIQTQIVSDYHDWDEFNESLDKFLLAIQNGEGTVKDIKFTTNFKDGFTYYNALIIYSINPQKARSIRQRS